MNALIGQDISIVSEVAGTTTDPVYKSMELASLGPITFIDTPGLDDVGSLGKLRIEKEKKSLYRADASILIVDSYPTEYEDKLSKLLLEMEIPFIIVINKADLLKNESQKIADIYTKKYNVPVLIVSAKEKIGLDNISEILKKIIPADEEIPFLSDLIDGGDLVILVVPVLSFLLLFVQLNVVCLISLALF